jgi:uncharacterized CHY-type Zn-finger protein
MAAPTGSVAGTLTPYGTLHDGTKIVLLAWSDTGMHTIGGDYSTAAIMPLGNTLYAQVLRRGSSPRLITSGFTVEYSFPGNTYSGAGGIGRPAKSDFWLFVQQLFNLTGPNTPASDFGFKGKGLSGTFDKRSGYLVAEAIPLTDISDSQAGTAARTPYQKARVTVRDTFDGREVAALTVVVPVSSESRCDSCHDDNGVASRNNAIATGDTYTNILALHDKVFESSYADYGVAPLMNQRPVQCSRCHPDVKIDEYRSGLGRGRTGIPPLSWSIHFVHRSQVPATTNGCLQCHPGPTTKGLRDHHLVKLGYGCTKCHGKLTSRFTTTNSTSIKPWVDEPRCDRSGCHKKLSARRIAQKKNTLYHNATGHGGVYCAACHDSAHALAASKNAADRVKFVELQGSTGNTTWLKKCSVCHIKSKPGGKTKVH